MIAILTAVVGAMLIAAAAAAASGGKSEPVPVRVKRDR